MFCVNGRGLGRSPWTLGGRLGRRTGIRPPAIVLENIVCCVGGDILWINAQATSRMVMMSSSTPHVEVPFYIGPSANIRVHVCDETASTTFLRYII